MNTLRRDEDERHHASLNAILEALGEEFQELGQFTERFQQHLGPALLQVANNKDCHRDVQSLDLLSQRLAALSSYVLTIGQLLPDEWRVNSHIALHNIALSDLQYRLQGTPLPPEQEKRSGELELF